MRKTRKRLGITQDDFGQLVGAHSKSVSEWERTNTDPSVSVQRICNVINKRRKLPRPEELQRWIRTEGGQAALEHILAAGTRTSAAAGEGAAFEGSTAELIEENPEVLGA